MKRDSYVFEYKDIGEQAKAYVKELAHFIDVAQNENKKIYSQKNLL